MGVSNRIRGHVRANVVGYVALFIALTIAPAWAASIGANDLKRNAVRSKHIQASNVKGSDIASSAVGSAEIADESLTGADILGLPWSKVTGMPAGFADGIDDVGDGPSSDVVCSGCIGSTDLAANAVTGAKVEDDSLGGAEIDEAAVVIGGGLLPSGDVSGTIENAQLRQGSVGPSELAAGAVGAVQIDPSQVQARVTGSCSAGQLVTAVTQSGNVQCAPGVAGASPFEVPFPNLPFPQDCTGKLNGWYHYWPDINGRFAYYRDASGFVHLEGAVKRCGPASPFGFDLPPGFRPTGGRRHVPILAGAGLIAAGTVEVWPDGSIELASGDTFGLDGVTFRCGPSGQDGCP